MSITSKRPSVAKLCFHWTAGHSLLIWFDTFSASLPTSLRSLKAVAEKRVTITYVPMEIDLPQKSLLEFAPERNPYRVSGLPRANWVWTPGSRAAAPAGRWICRNDVVDVLICG